MTAHNEAADPKAGRSGEASTPSVPEYPTGGDPYRRIALHYTLVQRRRWSKELDELCRSAA